MLPLTRGGKRLGTFSTIADEGHYYGLRTAQLGSMRRSVKKHIDLAILTAQELKIGAINNLNVVFLVI